LTVADFNGDGFSDLVFGNPWESSPAMNTVTSPNLPRSEPGYPSGVTSGSGWACGGSQIDECSSGSSVPNFGMVRILYGSGRGFQTPRNTGLSSNQDIQIGNPGVLDTYGTETAPPANRPCESSSNPEPACQVTYLYNPVWENILFGYGRLDHRFGFSLTSADVNKDGYPDLLVGAPTFEDLSCFSGAATARNYGRVYVFYGSEFGVLAAARTEYYSPDLLANCPVLPETDSSSGLTSGSNKLRSLQPSLETYGISTNNTGRQFGFGVSTAGDVNGDNFEDVLILAPYESTPGQNQNGTGYLYYGPLCPADNDFNLTQDFQRSDSSADNLNRQKFFNGQAPAGTDVIDLFTGTFTAAISSPCYRGQSSSMKPIAQKFRVFDPENSPRWGSSYTAGRPRKGDFNKDGYDDIVIGTDAAGDQARNLTNVGRGVVFFGSDKGLFTADFPSFSVVANNQGVFRPFSILPSNYPSQSLFFRGNLSSGDINGDGSMDLLVPSRFYSGSGHYLGINIGTFLLLY
jgi:hypothetical protein